MTGQEITVPKEIVSAKDAKLRPWATVVYRALERAPEKTLAWSEVYALVEGEVDVGAVIGFLRGKGVGIAAVAGQGIEKSGVAETSFVLVSKTWAELKAEQAQASAEVAQVAQK